MLRVAALVGALSLAIFNPPVVQAEAVVNFDNGYSMTVPSGWEVVVQPEGFNSGMYDPRSNPRGRLGGWGGWPNYDLFVKEFFNCEPGELAISPAWCPPAPELIVTPDLCEPVPMPKPEKPPKVCKDKDHKHKPTDKRHK